MTKDSTQEALDVKLDAILIAFFNAAEEDVHSDNFKGGTLITTSHSRAKKAIKALLDQSRLSLLEEVLAAAPAQSDETAGENHLDYSDTDKSYEKGWNEAIDQYTANISALLTKKEKE